LLNRKGISERSRSRRTSRRRARRWGVLLLRTSSATLLGGGLGIHPGEGVILGYYSLSAASLAFERLTEADRKGVPAYPVPAVRIGRLASSLSVRGLGLGELLLQNAIKRILQARNTLGVHAVLVEAKNSAAEGFYRKYGFRLCDPKSRRLYLPLGVD
jgi:GNAT superfamily N-acetyltransferase